MIFLPPALFIIDWMIFSVSPAGPNHEAPKHHLQMSTFLLLTFILFFLPIDVRIQSAFNNQPTNTNSYYNHYSQLLSLSWTVRFTFSANQLDPTTIVHLGDKHRCWLTTVKHIQHHALPAPQDGRKIAVLLMDTQGSGWWLGAGAVRWVSLHGGPSRGTGATWHKQMVVINQEVLW